MIVLWVAFAIVACFGVVALFGAPYVPTLQPELRAAFRLLYKVGPRDVVVDLGSGDGRVLLEAVRQGARGVGYELNPFLAAISRLRVRSGAVIHMRDMWGAVLPVETTLVYVFTVSRDVRRLSKLVQSHADTHGCAFHVMTFGPPLKDRTPLRTLRGHSLYEIHPIQGRSA